MSTKGDGKYKTATSKMIQKAKSFKDDIKSKIIRRTPSVSRNGSPEKGSPKTTRKKKGFQRVGSFNEGSKSEKKVVQTATAVDRLNQENKKVTQTLGYLQDVVDKAIPIMLPGSATAVLETVLELITLISNYQDNQESNMLVSAYSQVYQSLANLIRWSDKVMLTGDTGTVTKQDSDAIIGALRNAVAELVKLSVEKLQQRPQGGSTRSSVSPIKSPSSAVNNDSCKRSSLPDIPLTPREQKILQETRFGFDDGDGDEDDVVDGPPPPKPPLPAGVTLSTLLSRDSSHQTDDVFGALFSVPPPLPEKKRCSSTESTYDNATPRNMSTSSHEVLTSGASGDSTPVNQSPHSSLRKSQLQSYAHAHMVMSNNAGITNNIGDGGPFPNITFTDANGPINDVSKHFPSLTTGSTGFPNFPRLGDSLTPHNLSPHSSSPMGSMSSIEDMLSDSSTLTGSVTASYQAYTAARMSHYDNFEQTKEIKNLTAQINQLTCSVHEENTVLDRLSVHSDGSVAAPGSDCTDGAAPPLPRKRSSMESTGVPRLSVESNGMARLSPGRGSGNSLNMESPTQGVSAQFVNKHISQERPNIMSNYDNVLASMRNDALEIPFKSSIPESGIRTSHSAMAFSSTSFSSSSSSSSFKAENSSSQVNREVISKSVHMAMSRQCFSSSQIATEFPSNSLKAKEEENQQNPPPLPEKRRQIDAYMAMVGQQYAAPSWADMTRHSMQAVNHWQTRFVQHQMEVLDLFRARSNTLSRMSDLSSGSSDMFSLTSASSGEDSSGVSSLSGQSAASGGPPPPPLPGKQGSSLHRGSEMGHGDCPRENGGGNSSYPRENSSSSSERSNKETDSGLVEMIGTLDDVDVTDQIIFKKPNEDGPDVQGGTVDALVVHATTTGKNNFMYQEAFLTTYRTFLTPASLLDKLLYRYRKFSHMLDTKKKKLSRNAFSLLVRVVDDLCIDVDEEVIQTLLDLVLELVSDGELTLARILRKKVLEKVEYRKQYLENRSHQMTLLSSYHLQSRPNILTDFKSIHLAEQMTRLDSEIFLKIEIPEVLLWAKEQNEDQSPNLTKFTEHFNKMSYWCRTQVLQQEDPKERERYMIKFIKIMKHLRRMNNFNSYLAILSALDSAPLRRLEWQRQNLEALKEFCQLIDSSSSFRAYRLALAEAEPPCIPYIGLILQDLTFVHIGNPDHLEDKEIVNFSKRWQQFNILENMKRFQKCNFHIQKNAKILAFFNDFEEFMSEESLWQISETIKPRKQTKCTNP